MNIVKRFDITPPLIGGTERNPPFSKGGYRGICIGIIHAIIRSLRLDKSYKSTLSLLYKRRELIYS